MFLDFQDPAGSCRSKSTITSSIDKVKLQSVKISVCGPIGRHTAKDSFGSSGLSPGPGKCHQQMKSLPNLPPIYRSPSSKGSTKRSSQSPSSSQILSSNRSRHQQTPSKCSILTPVHEWQNIRGNVRAKCLVKQENLESDLQKDKRDLVESLGAGSSQPSPAKYRHRGLRNIEHNHVSNLNAGLRSGFKQERRVLRSERGKLSDGMKRNSQNSYRSPALAQAIDTIVRKSPENAELSSIICIYKQTKNKDDDTVDSEKRQRIETKGMTAVKGDQQFTDSEVFSRGNSPVGQHAGIKSERSQNQIQIDFSSDNQPEKASKLVQHDPSLVCKPADINPTSINNDFNTGTEQATRREPDSKANNA